MIHSAKLDMEQFIESDSRDKPIELDLFSYWADHGYPVESIEEAHAVVNEKSEGENTAHIVVKIETLSKPLELADVAADQMTMWACDCKDYQFNQGVDLSERTLDEWGSCKHVQAVSKVEKAKADSNQDTIV